MCVNVYVKETYAEVIHKLDNPHTDNWESAVACFVIKVTCV